MTVMPFAFIPGTQELLIIAFVALLIFGNRLPSVMRSLGKSVTEFKKGVAGIEDDIDLAGGADKKTPPHA
jgi:sec-independent protein translocase protein TatA